ncbi:MAG: hypothetical protein ABI401_06690 [Candidatus Dormibacter sp.]
MIRPPAASIRSSARATAVAGPAAPQTRPLRMTIEAALAMDGS